MTLIISIIPKANSEINTKELEERVQPPHNNLFGVESWRYAVWGHDIIRRLGCPMLYSLKNSNIYAFDENLDALRAELETIQAHSGEIAAETGVGEPSAIRFRCDNALEMLQIVDTERASVGIAIE